MNMLYEEIGMQEASVVVNVGRVVFKGVDHGAGPFTCQFCQKVMPSWNGLVLHLSRCPSRVHDRIYEINNIRFTVKLNPLRRYTRALFAFAKNPKVDARAFASGLMLLKECGHIVDFKLENAPVPPAKPT